MLQATTCDVTFLFNGHQNRADEFMNTDTKHACIFDGFYTFKPCFCLISSDFSINNLAGTQISYILT